MKKLVIFDMSGILFDTEKVLMESNQQAFAQENIEFTYADYIKYAGTSQKQNLALTIEKVKDPSLGNKIYQNAHEIRQNIYQDQGAPKMPGLDECLKELDAHSIDMLVASSNDLEVVKLLLEKADISHYFKGIVAGDQLTQAKPHPEIFLKALAMGGADKNQAVAIEDSINGVEAGHQAGLDVIMVPNLIQPTEREKKNSLAIVDRVNLILPYILEN